MKFRAVSPLYLLGRYKYPITLAVGVVIVGAVDENSVLQRIEYERQASGLREEIRRYNAESEAATRQLRELERDPSKIERVARERYFMKADDEDIFVLSEETQD